MRRLIRKEIRLRGTDLKIASVDWAIARTWWEGSVSVRGSYTNWYWVEVRMVERAELSGMSRLPCAGWGCGTGWEAWVGFSGGTEEYVEWNLRGWWGGLLIVLGKGGWGVVFARGGW